MLSFKYLIQRLKGKDKPESKPSVDELRTSLKTRFLNFRTLLKANNEILEIMSDMEEMLRSGRSFGMSYIRANCTAMSVNLFKLVQNINILSGNKYNELFNVSERIWGKISEQLERKKKAADARFILPLESIDKEKADETGNKMANLGEIKNRVGLQVPDGFVITASAYERFLEYNNLQDEINRRLQTLDIGNIEMLHRNSSEIQQLIVHATIPQVLADEIMNAHRALEQRLNREVHISMRSSALGEDSSGVSFAGQYRSALNVSREFILYTYKEIIASKYTLQAISYRLNRGFRDEDMPMCVGCMEMVDAVSGGVMYSRDPGDFSNKFILINSSWGLAKSVVDGAVSPDTFIVYAENSEKRIKTIIQPKNIKVISGQAEGVVNVELQEDEKNRPSLSNEQAMRLAEIAVKLEDYFGLPQDIEWSIDHEGTIKILQARPLQKTGERIEISINVESADISSHEVVINKGLTVSRGAASGEAFLVDSTLDMLQFPKGAVLITRYPFPQWASLLSHASAVVTDSGSIAGHLATVSREFSVPALFNTLDATQKIKTGELITVDADGCRVYKGRVASLLQKKTEKAGLMEGSPVQALLRNILVNITPLNLTDPDSLDFKAVNCATVHDITRFCHEMAVREIFDFTQEYSFRKYPVKRLMTHVPTQWWVLNLDDGFREGVKGKRVKIGDITSVPMLAIWEGINAVKWEGPPPVDTKGFMSILFEATIDTELEPSMQSSYTDKNYLIISRDFCNVSSRFGFHFSTVEAYVTDLAKDNYISFNFKGGAADFDRKARRVEFIGRILERFGFRIELHGDAIFARIEGYEKKEMIERLKIMGYLLMHTRQIDMIMNNEVLVNEYYENFINDIKSFVKISAETREKSG